jgi:phosphoglycerate dehydrogenase-like enzyme
VPYTIFADLAATDAALQLLRSGTGTHRLVFPNRPAVSCLHQSEPDPLMSAAEIVLGQPDPQALLESTRLKWVQISSSSISRYDYPSFRATVAARGIAVCNSASVYSEACAEHVLAFMLAQSRHLPRGLTTWVTSASPEWNDLRNESVPLYGQTALIVGYGAIARRLTEMLAPFAMQVLGYRRTKRGDETASIVTADQLPGALGVADHVIDILPDSAETREFFDTSRFMEMKPGSVFYNIGRGSTVNQDALLSALTNHHVKAAWLDVTDPEPLPHLHPLVRLPNCFITPHVAGGHRNESETFVRHFLQNLRRFEQGHPLRDRVL